MINNIQIINLKQHKDERGAFSEIFRAKWFSKYDNSKIQINHSFSKRGVLRGLHYHYWQYDYWYVVNGLLQVGLMDLRKDSDTFKQSMTFELDNTQRLFIPSGIAHGFFALKNTHLIYVVNNYYDPNDDLNLNYQHIIWQFEPLEISERDKNAPFLDGIKESSLVF